MSLKLILCQKCQIFKLKKTKELFIFRFKQNYINYLYIIKILAQKKMFLQSSQASASRNNNFLSSSNPEENSLKASRFQSPSLKLGRIKSWKFTYQSPSRVQKMHNDGPLEFSRHAQKLVVRKLPKFHEEILQNDPLKNSKIIQNINFFRQVQRKKNKMQTNRCTETDITQENNQVYEVSRTLIDVKSSIKPTQLRMSRSLSCTFKPLDSSRCSVIQGLKSGDSLFTSRLKQNGLLSSRLVEIKPKQNNVTMASSRYFESILGK